MFIEDRQAFLRDFGVTVVRNGQSYTGIFDNEAYTFGDGSVPVDMQQPLLLMSEFDTTGWSEGDKLTVDGVDYTLRTFTPDGTGFTQLGLSKL